MAMRLPFGAFILIDDGEFSYTVLISCENELFGRTASIQSVCAYFFANGYEDAPAVELGANPIAPISGTSTSAYLPKEKEDN